MGLNKVIVNVGAGNWYPKGTARLVRSLQEGGYEGAIMANIQIPHGCTSHQENPYAFKVVAIEKALQAGYTKIFWMDSSIYCQLNPNHIFEIVNEHGYYFVKNGYSIGQETNDFCLKWFGVSRDKAMEMPQIASGFFGLDMEREICKEIFNKWRDACNAGCFKGSRTHSKEDSKDPRFLWHRQDQSALSLAIAPYNLKLDDFGPIVTYNRNQLDSLYICNGM
jgi:hypothetical protein